MAAGLGPDTFDGITVVDFSRLLPGPFCTSLLVELGARVIKVEAPRGGDYARWYPPLVDESDRGFGAFFESVNLGKESVAIDLKAPEGREIALALVRRADVVVEGFRPGVMERLGLGEDALREVAPEVVYCRITGFGQTGPDAARAGHDLGYLARSGALGQTGPAGGPPVMPAVQVADLAGGALQAAFAIAAALFRRERTGRGATLDVAMVEGVMHMLRPALRTAAVEGAAPARGMHMLTGGLPCYRTYATADGRYLAVAALEPHFWMRLCTLIERPDLAPEGLTGGEAGRAVMEQLEEVFAARSLSEWLGILEGHDVCVEPVLTLEELAADAQHVARGMLQGGSSAGLVSNPLERGRDLVGLRCPRLAAHTQAVLREAGVDDARIAALAEAGVIAVG